MCKKLVVVLSMLLSVLVCMSPALAGHSSAPTIVHPEAVAYSELQHFVWHSQIVFAALSQGHWNILWEQTMCAQNNVSTWLVFTPSGIALLYLLFPLIWFAACNVPSWRTLREFLKKLLFMQGAYRY